MKSYILLAVVFLPLLSVAQRVTVSDEITIRDDQAYFIMDDQRGRVILFRDQATTFTVHGFNEQMKQEWEKEIELDKKRPEVEDITSTGGDFCVFYTFRNKQDVILKVRRYNPAANLADSVTIKIYESSFYKPNLYFDYSEDNKIAVLWSVTNDREISAMAFHMGRMKLLWEKTFTEDGLLFSRDFYQSLVDNNGNFYLFMEKDNRRSKIEEHSFNVYQIKGGGEEPMLRRFNVPMGGKLTYDAFFTFDNLNNTVVAGGFYSVDNPARAEGIFYLNVDEGDPEKKTLAFHEFDKEFVNILLEKDKAKNKGVPEVSAQELVLRRDGGIILIGEMNKEFLRGGGSAAYYSRTGIRPIVDHYYDDVFLISMHPDGEIHWKKILHKKQYSQDDDASFSSYFLAKTPTALRVVFNDEIKPECTVSEYIVRGNGEADRNAVMNTENKELSLRFRNAIQISASEIIVPSERRGKLKLVKVEY